MIEMSWVRTVSAETTERYENRIKMLTTLQLAKYDMVLSSFLCTYDDSRHARA